MRNKPEFRLTVVYDDPFPIKRGKYFNGWPEPLVEATKNLIFNRLLIKDPERRLLMSKDLLRSH